MVEIKKIARPLSATKIVDLFVRWRAVDTSGQLAAKTECVLTGLAASARRSARRPHSGSTLRFGRLRRAGRGPGAPPGRLPAGALCVPLGPPTRRASLSRMVTGSAQYHLSQPFEGRYLSVS